MEQEKYINCFDAETWGQGSPDASYIPPGPLFEEREEEEAEDKKPALEDRIDTMEYRMGRTLLCLNQCQKEIAELRKLHKGLAQEQSGSRDAQERHRKITLYCTYATIGLILAAQVKHLTALGWLLFDRLALLLDTEPEVIAGGLASIVLLWLLVKLARLLIRKLSAFRRGKRRCDDAVRDR